VANESLTKEERIQLSTRWPPDTKLYLKLLRVHDEMVHTLSEVKDYSESGSSGLAEELGAIIGNREIES
jgi:hypothetical protein